MIFGQFLASFKLIAMKTWREARWYMCLPLSERIYLILSKEKKKTELLLLAS